MRKLSSCGPADSGRAVRDYRAEEAHNRIWLKHWTISVAEVLQKKELQPRLQFPVYRTAELQLNLEFTERLTVSDKCKVVQCAAVGIFTDESNGSIAKTCLGSTGVQTSHCTPVS